MIIKRYMDSVKPYKQQNIHDAEMHGPELHAFTGSAQSECKLHIWMILVANMKTTISPCKNITFQK